MQQNGVDFLILVSFLIPLVRTRYLDLPQSLVRCNLSSPKNFFYSNFFRFPNGGNEILL